MPLLLRLLPWLFAALIAGCGGGSASVAQMLSCILTLNCDSQGIAVTATAADGQVHLDWPAKASVSSYEIGRSASRGGPFEIIATTRASAFVDDQVENGVRYWYVVAASGQTGLASAAVDAMPRPAPAAPGSVTLAVGAARVTLAWTPGAWTDSVAIQRSSSTDGPRERVAAVTGASSWTDTGVRNGATYWYWLQAANTTGTSSPVGALQAIPIEPVSGLQAVASGSAVSLFWNAALGATLYGIETADSAAGPWTVQAQVSRNRAQVTLPAGVRKYFRISARNATATGEPSAVASALLPAGTAEPQPAAEDPARNRIGMNLWFNTDWDGSGAFVDAFKQSRPWQDGRSWHAAVAVDSLGWPLADASTVLYSGSPEQFNGTYRLLFNGQADVSIMWAPGTVTNQVYDSATNTTSADVTFAMTTGGSVGLIFLNTRRHAAAAVNSGFTNARLYRPGYPTDGSAVFTTPFLAALGKAGVVRMMEWTHGSSNVVQAWADRVTPQHATQGGIIGPTYVAPDGAAYSGRPLGVAIEHQIQLCNVLLIDCWINVPPVADDDYVKNLALALRFGTDGINPYLSAQAQPRYPPLDPALRVYLEYSNENWNSASGFLAFHLIKALCSRLPAGHPVLSPLPDSLYTAVWRYPAWRIAVISELFRMVFGDAAMMTRVRPVLMAQRGNANNTLGAALTWLDGWLTSQAPARSVRSVIHGAGGSAYYGANNMLSAVAGTLFAAGNFPDASAVYDITTDSLWAHNYGLKLVAYEGGPSLNFSTADNQSLNADPRMKAVVQDTHERWSSLGGDLLVYYALRGPSEWEFTPDLRLATTAKLQAIDALQASPAAPAGIGPSLPGTLSATGDRSISTGSTYVIPIDGVDAVLNFLPGTFVAQAGHAGAAFSGMLSVRGWAPTDTTVRVWVNGEAVGTLTLAGTSGERRLYDSTALPVPVPRGVVVLRLEVVSGNLGYASIQVR
jgi:hypothetical protein